MNSRSILNAAWVVALLICLGPVTAAAQSASTPPGLPPISQQVVREGDFALSLYSALGLGTVPDETEAESALGRVGITPRNGWIADYPMTPDIIGELKTAVEDAARAGKITLAGAEALKRLDGVSAELGLGIRPYTGTANSGEIMDESAAEEYPNPSEIGDYYQAEGPPIVTYYAPPPDYYYLYGWIPYPFWWSGFWFPGYFILHDFHRPLHFHDRVSFVSNHFNDVRSHHVFRIDPVARFSGRTFAGIGVSGRGRFISTGVPRSQRAIFNAPRPQAAPGMRQLPGMRSGYRPSPAPARNGAPAYRGGRSFSAPARSAPARSFQAPSAGGPARSLAAPSPGGGRSSGPPSGGGRGGARR